MEFQQVLGIRRSIRYFEPNKPVEQEKIQKILEACRIASCAVNAHWLKADVVKKYTKVPDDWIPFYVMNVGYPAESREAGGQRPRPEFSEQYHLNQYGNPFPRDPKVVKELEESKLFTTPARPDNGERRKEV